LRVGDRVAAILSGQEAAGHGFETERGQAQQTGVNEKHDGSEPGEPPDGVAIGVRAPGKDFVETAKEPTKEAVDEPLKPILLRPTWPEEERGERWRKSERIQRRDGGRDRNGERKLAEKLA
jgi:hypothetical protein